jgi:hypothetical protein
MCDLFVKLKQGEPYTGQLAGGWMVSRAYLNKMVDKTFPLGSEIRSSIF